MYADDGTPSRARDIRGARLRAELKEQGRSVTWLARATGYTRPYVSNVLSGTSPWTEEFQKKAAEAMGEPLVAAGVYMGRSVKVPAALYNADRWEPLVAGDAYEEAWKRSWVQEHGQAALATAAERAWRLALASGHQSGGDAS